MTVTTTDRQQVEALFTQFLDGWNAGSGEAFMAPFTDTIDFIGFDGTYFTDRAASAAFHQTLFDKWLRGSRLVGTPEVRFTGPDSALIVAYGDTVLRGKSRPSKVRASIQTLTAVRTTDGWRLTSFQNTRWRPMTGRNVVLWLLTDLLWRLSPARAVENSGTRPT
jgi:uncharacterized protein (TIGR02246 family)